MASMCSSVFFFFQAEDGIRDRSPSRGLGDVYKRQVKSNGTVLVSAMKMNILQMPQYIAVAFRQVQREIQIQHRMVRRL